MKPDFEFDYKDLEEFEEELGKNTESQKTQRIKADPSNVEQGLAKLVLTLIELIRRLMEKQALHRVDRGTLTDEEMERVGLTLMKLEQKIQELKVVFGLENEELNLDLGPLGDLM